MVRRPEENEIKILKPYLWKKKKKIGLANLSFLSNHANKEI